jgi:hypothetical protein
LFRSVWVVALVGALALLSCKREADPGLTASVSARPPAPPAPAELFADVVVAKPGQTWRTLRALGGRPASLLPENIQILLASAWGLPLLAADSIDAELPLFGALLQGGAEGSSLVLGVHVKSGRELVAKLTTGNAPAFRAEPADPNGLVRFASTQGKPEAFVLGVLDNYLLFGPATGLGKAGPYVARTLSAQPLPREPIAITAPKAALAGPFSSALRAAWGARRAELESAERRARAEHGRPADFADPAAVLLAADAAVETLFGVLEGAERVTVSVEPFADRLNLRLEVAAGNAEAALGHGLPVGDLTALTRLPWNTVAALLLRTEPAPPEQAGQDLIQLLGARATPAESKLITEAFARWEASRRDLSIYALLAGSSATLGYAGELRDPAGFRQGARAVLELLKLRSLAAPLAEFAGQPKVAFSSVRPAALGEKVDRALIGVTRPKTDRAPSLLPERIEVLWFADGGRAFAAAGAKAEVALGELVGAARAERPSLGQDAWLAGAVERAGGTNAAALWLDLAALGSAAKGGPAPLLALLGKAARSSWLSLDVSPRAVEILAQASQSVAP